MGTLVRDGKHGRERCPVSAVLLLHQGGLCLIGDALAPLEVDGHWPLMTELLGVPSLPIGDDPGPALARLFALPHVPSLALPDGMRVLESHIRPTPGVRFVADPLPWRRYGTPMAGVQLVFRYGLVWVDSADPGTTRFCAASSTLYHRDPDAERDARDRLLTLGASTVREAGITEASFVLPRSQLLRIAQQLTREGWWVEADGRAFRVPSGVRANVRSGVDWFDLAGTVDYGDTTASLRDVLDARRRGADVVELADGSYGMLPHDWLDRLGPVLAGGTPTEGGARFRSSQLALLDALLATLPEVDVDAAFAQAREALAGFDRIGPADPPPSFTGTLRGYQRDGLGWLHFLRTFGFGGCLADDMGLGKTIQVLALLDARRVEGHGPSLVVVPRSLVFNWRAEAERFAPQLRTADWSGTARREDGFDASGVDVVFVTYGTLRRDAAELAAIPFDYVVLDEAQAIKNRGTATAKASRVLQASHRLALSGTPVENRLDELWSLLDFLNPGMLGTSARFTKSLHDLSPDSGADDVLARALRPVILRRTKAQVAPDLPERVERTLEVELEPKQRAFYNQLHARVRADVLQQVDAKGLGRSRMHILEGLLRLRQAACHPVLADARRRTLPSAKLEALVPALADVAAEGNKALVFSQFTEFLALVRTALDAEKIPYEYLDGRTKDRQARVERFQEDPAVPVFLISLKAGGHGLNLTAADYVYLLDPWWNPAVEAQAIDRAHRIGRTRRVIATRLVARDTIEEKILALQASKRALADAILTADRGGLASIGREELELLLG
jgi:superfamily II DNA or RNA helicase